VGASNQFMLLPRATVMCTTSFTPPPLASAPNFYVVIVAKPYAWLQEPSRSRSVVIFIKYREVSTRIILPNFINHSAKTALYSRFGGHKGGIVTGRRGRRGSVSLQFGSPGRPKRFSRATEKVLARSHNRSL